MIDPEMRLRRVGTVRSPLRRREDCPSQGDEGAPGAVVEIDGTYRMGLSGIRPGSEIVLITWLHRARRDVLRLRPRNDPARAARGVFATRSPDRPNPLGIHRVRVLAVDESGGTLHVEPLEVLDGTPVVDVKPARRGA